jgi:hypothetical protein
MLAVPLILAHQAAPQLRWGVVIVGVGIIAAALRFSKRESANA